MFKTPRFATVTAAALVLASGLSGAQTPVTATTAAAAPKAVATPAAASAPTPGLPSALANAATTATDKRVIEDDTVRIEETRLRGQTQNVTVQSKLPGVRAYEVIMPPLGKDPSQDKGAAGKRTWSLFDF